MEAVLELAILKAGLMRRENFGDFSKVKWSRSSRTDKGVHALAAVVVLKINCAAEHWERDPEGVQLADAINKCAFTQQLVTVWSAHVCQQT